MPEITQKQKEVIEIIENNTRYVFQGSSRQEAIDFISAHIEESKLRTRNHKASREIEDAMFFNKPLTIKPVQCVPHFYYNEDEIQFGVKSTLGDVTGEPRNNGDYGSQSYD